MKINCVFYETKGEMDYGYYLEIDGVREEFPFNPNNDPQRPQYRSFNSMASCLKYVLEKRFNCEVIETNGEAARITGVK